MTNFFHLNPKSHLWIAFFMLMINVSFAQSPTENISVSGKITATDTQGGLSGVNIALKGTSKGTSTDAGGNFTISVPNSKSVLVVSYVGYLPQEITVGNQTKLNLSLSPDAKDLNEVVVVGYGTVKKTDLTGSVKSLKSSEFNKGIINSPQDLLQGKVAGVNVTSASGEPGGTQSITIRGPGGVRTGSTPLFVVDGLALDNSSTGGATNPLTFLNPQDIETIDVLKDASATAIYGSRGANGVILITTKKGKAGVSSVTYSTSVGISTIARALSVF